MAGAPAFRIDCATTGELASFLDGFRRDALRVLARRFTLTVADDAARRIDLHRAGVDVRDASASPLKDAVASIRSALAKVGEDPPPELDLDMELQVHVLADAVLARLAFGNPDYLRLLSSRPGVRPYDWSHSARRPPDVPEAEWRERGALWSTADAQPRLGAALSMRMLDGRIPAPKWPQVQRLSPPLDLRVRRTAKALAWKERSRSMSAPGSAEEAVAFSRWLQAPEGARTYDRARRLAEAALPKDIGRDQLIAYGSSRSPAQRAAAIPEGVRPIDHADVYEAVDGQVFVVVWWCGLTGTDRVYVQVSDRQVDFVQAGKHYGSVPDAPHAALDILAMSREVTLVEMRRFGDRVEVKAKHVAIVRNTTLSDTLGGTMRRWRDSAGKGAAKAVEELA